MSGAYFIVLLLFILALMVVALAIAASVQRRARAAERREEQALGETEFKSLLEGLEQELSEDWPVRQVTRPGWRLRYYLLMSKDQREIASLRVKWHGEMRVEWKARVDLATVISAELQQSEKTIMRLETTGTTKRSGSLARAAVGGALFGGVGAIVGAASAGSTTIAKTTSKSETIKGTVYLVLGTTDLEIPLHKFEMNSRDEGEKWLHRVRGGLALLETR